MVAKEHHKVIEGKQQLIYVIVLDYEEAAEDAAIYHDDTAFYEEDGIGLVWEGVTEKVGDMHTVLKSSSHSSYVLEPSHLLTKGFGGNRKSQEKLFNCM